MFVRAKTHPVTCLDPRCVPERFFGPEIGIPVFRNAGGRATPDAIRSIMILRSLIGASGVLVIHHTGTPTSQNPPSPFPAPKTDTIVN